ncbi:MAG: TolC family protein [Pirellulaceae bacterium]
MSRKIVRWAAIVQICLVLCTGCSPTQPFFVPRDESLANYLGQSLDIEYADVHVESLPEATQAHVPFGASNLPTDFIDLSLEDCISIALQNTKIIRVVGGTNSQSGSVNTALLSANAGQMPSIYDPALTAATANTQPLAIDNQGNRIAPRGAARANQVGGVEDALSEFDAQASMILGYNTTDRPRNVGQGNVFNPQLFQAVDANAQAALSKRLATGTIATARFTTVYSRNNVPASGNQLGSTNFGRSVPSDYTSALELQVTQPLMRGRGTLVNRIPVILARINEDLAVHDFEANIRRLLKDVEDAYWDLHCGYRAFDAAKVSRDSALDLWRVAYARNKIGGNTPPEAVAQAKSLYYQFEGQLRSSLLGNTTQGFDPRGLYGREQVLREKMGWGPTDGRLIRPSDEPNIARVNFEWCDIVAEGLTRNTELRRHKFAIKQRELELISAKNQILPQLDWSGTYRFLGVGDQFAAADRSGLNFPNPGSNSLEGLTDGDFQEIGMRLEFTPQAVGKRRQLANIQRGHLEIKKTQEELREKEVALVNELSTAWRDIESMFGQIQINGQQWASSEEEIAVYNDKIAGDVGELGQLLDNLLRAEERRARAQLNYFQSVCRYNQALVHMHFLKGSLMDLNNIQLGEGAWVEKAYWDAEERARERASGIYFDYGYTRPAVVSNGPVATGGATEGNISDSGMTLGQPSRAPVVDSSEEAEEVPPAASDDDKEPEPLPELNRAPTANLRSVPRVQTASVTGASGSEAHGVNSDRDFNWGEFGIDGAPNQKVGGRPVRVINNSQANQPSPIQSEPRVWQAR